MAGAILRMTRIDPVSHVRDRRSSLRQVESKNRNWHEAVSSALDFPFLKEVSQNCFILMLSTLKNEEVSQNCFILMLSTSKNEEVSQNCFVFGVVKCKN